MQIKNVAAGEMVSITGVILRQSSGQALLWVPGIGESGTWSIVNTAECTYGRANEADIHEKFARWAAKKLGAK